jgi:hypothetical protein
MHQTKISFDHNHKIVHLSIDIGADEVKWDNKQRLYYVPGPRQRRLPRALWDQVQDKISEAIWREMLKATQRLRRGHVGMPAWRETLLSLLLKRDMLHIWLMRGGFDTVQYPVEELSRLFTDRDQKYIALTQWADKRYLDDLIEGIRAGAFGATLEFGNFQNRLKILLTEDIYDFSPWHAIIEEAMR